MKIASELEYIQAIDFIDRWLDEHPPTEDMQYNEAFAKAVYAVKAYEALHPQSNNDEED